MFFVLYMCIKYAFFLVECVFFLCIFQRRGDMMDFFIKKTDSPVVSVVPKRRGMLDFYVKNADSPVVSVTPKRRGMLDFMGYMCA